MIAARLAVLGLGHIGGSLALAARAAGLFQRIVGHDVDPDAAARALALGLCDELQPSPEDAVRGADLVLLAAPVRAIVTCARRMAPALAPGCVVTDVGSTKAGVVAACEAALGGAYVGGHPLAGTERAGPEAADATLFHGRKVFLTPTDRTERAALERVTALWQGVGGQVVLMDAERHDQVMAAISHLPHVAAYTLAGTLGELADGGRGFVGLTGGGFTDTTRIASTPSPMWVDVFLENRGPLLELIDAFAARLGALRAAITAGDAAAIAELLEAARRARARILGG